MNILVMTWSAFASILMYIEVISMLSKMIAVVLIDHYSDYYDDYGDCM